MSEPEPFDVRLAKVLDYLAHYFPDIHYQVVFHRVGKAWQFFVTADPHKAFPTIFCQVEGTDFNSLPEALFLKIKDRVKSFIGEATSKIEEKRAELELARNELEKRLKTDLAYLTLGQSLGMPQEEHLSPIPSKPDEITD